MNLAEVSDYDRLPLRGLENNAAVLLPAQEWKAHKAVIALSVPDDVWGGITSFYYGIEVMRMFWAELGHKHPLPARTLRQVRGRMRRGSDLVESLGQTTSADIDDLLRNAGTKRDFDEDPRTYCRSRRNRGRLPRRTPPTEDALTPLMRGAGRTPAIAESFDGVLAALRQAPLVRNGPAQGLTLGHAWRGQGLRISTHVR
jgi:hypothetical protein